MIKNRKKILILGGSGMLGKDLVDLFTQDEKYQVFTIFRNAIDLKKHNLKVFNFDLKEKSYLLKI